MASSSSNPQVYEARVPILSQPGGNLSDENAEYLTVPVQVVTDASQLPPEFLNPSAENPLVIGLDCEGVDLSRHGALCIMQVAFPDAIYLIDAVEGRKLLMQACKPALESSYITKVIHDCKRDSEALYFQFDIKLHNVIDTQIAYSLLDEQEGRKGMPDRPISFMNLLADPRYCGVKYEEKEEVHALLKKDPKIWSYRPLSELMIRTAASDVRFLLYIHHKMMQTLNEKSLWRLAVRGSLYCRCFCVGTNSEDWPPLPPPPASLVAEGHEPEMEILSVLEIRPGCLGRVIGRNGANIRNLEKSCNCQVHTGGRTGPKDKVFIIGTADKVRKAETRIRDICSDSWYY